MNTNYGNNYIAYAFTGDLEGYAYYVLEVENNKGEKQAYVQKLHRCANLCNISRYFVDEKLVGFVNCKTLKKAKALAEMWNNEYKKNKNYWERR